ncbi:hypothetical protein ACET3X_005676 [Alternaria dauci]|uniref:Cytosolic endo-beta-N-acetylglucosaminidase TIM barrel domain-containing protein n=1 Tax=Alternaria dauci TaxID=48095 RepID=A0ABR3UGV9_9PLEO
MAYLLGWKDILRPIRDGYRHLFPTPDTGPTPEERRRQREVDRLRGFAYFDTFDQLEAWKESDSDPLQRANTPLLRATDGTETRRVKGPVLLIHDYSGNYHDYESVSAIGVDGEFYSCEYLQFVDTFIYFSHKLACVPPPTWVNLLHRNGVEALGTLLIEPQTEGSERLLQHTVDESGNMHFPMANKLASIAAHFGFDGWLVNIEKPFPSEVWNAKLLEAFLLQLKANLGVGLVAGRRLIWYDALTTSNKISYQNQVNAANMDFALACSNILTNYCWKEIDVSESVKWCTYSRFLPKGNIYFGVDVWAQNKSDFRHPRVTWPEVRGGGTNTGMAVAKMADYGLPVGIFAPAWSFEHFQGHGRCVERAIWEGESLPEDLKCSCGDCEFWHPPNKEWPVLRTAKERVAGSEHVFYTDFSRAFATHGEEARDVFDGHDMHAQLGQQSILPRPAMLAPDPGAVRLSHRIENEGNRHILVITAQLNRTANSETIEEHLPLYKLDMPADGSLHLSAVPSPASPSYTTPQTKNAAISFYFKTTHGTHYLPCPLPSDPQQLTERVPNARIRELGVYLKGPWSAPVGETVRVLGIREICITPRFTLHCPPVFEIVDLELVQRGHGQGQSGEGHTVRLTWKVGGTSGSEWVDKGMVLSRVTGPMAWFVVRVDGVLVGRVYALECVLDEKVVEGRAGQDIVVEVTGVGFDGHELAEKKDVLRL